jgi:hypothetical protein
MFEEIVDQGLLASLVGDRREEDIQDEEWKRATVRMYYDDPLLWWVFWLPLILCPVLLVASVIAFAASVVFGGLLLVLGLFAGHVALWGYNSTSFVEGDRFVYRQFFGAGTMLTDTRYFNAEEWFMPLNWFTSGLVVQSIEFPASQQIFRTPENPRDDNALVVQLRQGRVTQDEHGVQHEPSDEQLVILRLVYRLAMTMAPRTVVLAYLEEFENNGVDAFTTKVEPDVTGLTIAVAERRLQGRRVDDLIQNAGGVAADIYPEIRDRLYRIGVELIEIAIEDTVDVRPEGFIQTRSRYVRIQLEADANVRIARARQNERVQSADANEQARVREIAAEVVIQTDLAAQLQLQLTNETLRQRGLPEIQNLIAGLSVYGNPVVGQFMRLIEGAVKGGKSVEFASELADGLKAMGLHTEGGDIMLFSSGSEEGVTNLVGAGTPLGSGAISVALVLALIQRIASKFGINLNQTNAAAGNAGANT